MLDVFRIFFIRRTTYTQPVYISDVFSRTKTSTNFASGSLFPWHLSIDNSFSPHFSLTKICYLEAMKEMRFWRLNTQRRTQEGEALIRATSQCKAELVAKHMMTTM
jgi:hypothetical protein